MKLESQFFNWKCTFGPYSISTALCIFTKVINWKMTSLPSLFHNDHRLAPPFPDKPVDIASYIQQPSIDSFTRDMPPNNLRRPSSFYADTGCDIFDKPLSLYRRVLIVKTIQAKLIWQTILQNIIDVAKFIFTTS